MHYLVSGRSDAPQPVPAESPTPAPLVIDSVDLPGAVHTHMPPLLYSLTPSPSVTRGRSSVDSLPFISRASTSSSVSTAVARHDIAPSFDQGEDSPLLSAASPDSLSPQDHTQKQDSFSLADESNSLEKVVSSVKADTSPLLPDAEMSACSASSVQDFQAAEELSSPSKYVSVSIYGDSAHKMSPPRHEHVATVLSLSVDSESTATTETPLQPQRSEPMSPARESPLLPHVPLLSDSSSSSDSLSINEALPQREITPASEIRWFRDQTLVDSPLVSPAVSLSVRSSQDSMSSHISAPMASELTEQFCGDSRNTIYSVASETESDVQRTPPTVLSLSVESTNAMSLATTIASSHVPSVAVATQTDTSDIRPPSVPLSSSWEYSLPALLHSTSAPPAARKAQLSFSLASTPSAASSSSVASSIDSLDQWRNSKLPSYQPPIVASSPLRVFGTSTSNRSLKQILSDSSPDSIDSWNLRVAEKQEQPRYASTAVPVPTITLSSSSESSQDSWSVSQPVSSKSKDDSNAVLSSRQGTAPASTITLSSSSSESSRESWQVSHRAQEKAKATITTRHSAALSPPSSPPAPTTILSSSQDSSIDSLIEDFSTSLDTLSQHSIQMPSRRQEARHRYADFITAESQRARGAIRSEFEQTRSRLQLTSHRSLQYESSFASSLPPSSRISIPSLPSPQQSRHRRMDDLLSLSSESTPRDGLADVLGLFASESSRDSLSVASRGNTVESKYSSRQLESMTLNVDSEHLSGEADDLLKSFLSLSSTSDIE